MRRKLPAIALTASILLHIVTGILVPPTKKTVQEENKPVLIRFSELPTPLPEPRTNPAPEPAPEPPPSEPVLKPEAPPASEKPALSLPPLPVEQNISTPMETTPVATPEAIELYSTLVRKQILKNRKYPTPSLRREEEGTVIVSFILNSLGELKSEPEVKTPSRYHRLNRAAITAVIDAAPYPRPVEGMTEGQLNFQIPIKFSLQN